MKYIVVVVFAATLIGCGGECKNSKFYQITDISPKSDNPLIATFEADGLGPCDSWQKTEVVMFSDSTHKYKLSQIVSRDIIRGYESKGVTK